MCLINNMQYILSGTPYKCCAFTEVPLTAELRGFAQSECSAVSFVLSQLHCAGLNGLVV